MCEEFLSKRVGKLQGWHQEGIWKSLRIVLKSWLLRFLYVVPHAVVGGMPSTALTVLTFFSWQSNKVPVVQHPHHVHPLTPLITYSNEHFTPGNPPPHLPADVDPKTGRWEVFWGFFWEGVGGSFRFCTLGERSAGEWISHAGAPKGACKMSNPDKILSF